jgi:transposase-like protein/transposase InsO family protein
MNTKTRFSPEVQEWAVPLVLERRREHESQWATVSSVAGKIGCSGGTLRKWVRQARRYLGRRNGLTGSERERLKQPERQNRELKRQRDPAQGIRVRRPGGARSPTEVMATFIDERRDQYAVEPICAQLPVAPSTHCDAKVRQADPARLLERAHRDARLGRAIRRVHGANFGAYGARKSKIWRQLGLGNAVGARCTVEQPMSERGPKGAVRDRRCRTTIAAGSAERPLQRVNRQFRARRRNELGVADFAYVATWSGFACVALAVDARAVRIIGCRVARSMRTDPVPDAPEQALWSWVDARGVLHHSERGSKCLSTRCPAPLADFGAEPFVGRVEDPRRRLGGDDRGFVRIRPKSSTTAARGEQTRRSFVRAAALGRLVQQPSATRADSSRAASGVGNAVVSSMQRVGGIGF